MVTLYLTRIQINTINYFPLIFYRKYLRVSYFIYIIKYIIVSHKIKSNFKPKTFGVVKNKCIFS